MDPFADPTRPPGGASTLSVIARSPFDLDDDEDELEVPYVPSSDDNPLLAQEYEDVAFAGGSRSGGFSRSSVSNAVGATASNGTQNEIADALDSADYAGGSSSAQPTTMGDFEGPNEGRGAQRTVYINEPARNAQAKYLHNGISTAKYNPVTFLPKFLFEQFSKLANLFFLFTVCIQQIPGVSPLNRYTTLIPLSIVILISAVKEIIEDWKRHQSDGETNARLCKVLRGTQFLDEPWRNITVGDIVRLENLDFFPADLILLSSSEPDGLCYIETSNLDGETNLKVKQARPETSRVSTALEANQLQGTIQSEAPNSSLYTYEGVLRLAGRDLPLTPQQLLLRGAQQRNTRWTYSIVINTGHETKLLRNASATPIKRTSVERMTNIQIIFLFLILMTLSIVCAAGTLVRTLYGTWEADFLNLNALGQSITDTGAAWGYFGLNILTYVILFNNLIPISLIVTMEVVKFVHALFINWDLDLYFEETETPAVARMSSLVEELGQVDYIFSDKTGTLTSNMMEFQMCTIGGRSYATKVPEDKRARVDEQGVEQGFYDMKKLVDDSKNGQNASIVQEFLALLAVCHTVIPETSDETGEVIYQASSPDEGALVKGAANLGYVFHTRRPRSVTISVDGVDQEYEILNICEFNSSRKRMSAVVRCPDGKIRLYCKGADSVILERLGQTNPFVDVTLANLEDYATEGLRTLCLAVREVGEEEYRAWNAIYEKAATSLGDREGDLDRAAELIERDLFLLGATAVEDKLQDGVPDTIHTLQLAGVKIFVLTGDRQETAINIGYSCKLLNEEMSLLICNATTAPETKEFLERKLMAIRGSVSSLGGDGPATKRKWYQMGRRARLTDIDVQPLALIIDGRTLDFALTSEIETLFLELACLCKAVICCRVSPLQKALVVKLFKRELDSVLLAIGDGANDVSMIQAAHIGIGINGREGLQAARSSDFAISQFRYLRKLLLVHGGWSYNRLSKMILYSFYKNIALYMVQFWFALDNAFSGQTLFESWTLSMYNVILTVFPPIAIGIFDQYLNARMLDRYPQLYKAGQKSLFFNVVIFWSWTLNALFHSALIYYLTCLAWGDSAVLSGGLAGGLWMLGTGFVYTVDIIAVVLKAALISNYWTKFEFMSYVGSIVIWVLFLLPLYALVGPIMGISVELEGMSGPLFGSAPFWFVGILVPLICLIRDYTWKYYQRTYMPKDYHVVQEIQRYNIPDYRPRMEWFRKAVHKVRLVQRLKRNRGYAFSQNESGEANLIRRYDTTRSKPKGF